MCVVSVKLLGSQELLPSFLVVCSMVADYNGLTGQQNKRR